MGMDSVTPRDELADLIKAVAERRDRQAFARLFDHFAPRLHGYLLRLGVDAALAEELAQEVMVTLWRKADQFDPKKSSAATWLYRIARNRRIDVLRRERSEPLDSEEAALVPSDEAGADDAIDSMQREDRVRAAIAGLPPEQMTLIRLAFFENLSHGEIAGKLALPLGTVKSRIRLAFTRLRRQLEADGVDTAG